MPDSSDIVVIGTGPSGMAAARTAKLRRPGLSVTAIRRERSYVPCALPYALGGMTEVDSYLKDESKLMTGIGIQVVADEVVRIAPEDHRVILSDGTPLGYGKLIVATGAEPSVLHGEGAQAANVFTIRTPADIHRVMAYRRQGMRVAVIGAGYIGVEVACMMRRAGHPVDLVEMLDQILPGTVDREFAEVARQSMEAEGICPHLGTVVEEMAQDDGPTVKELRLSAGAPVPTDLVVLALGVRPRLALFRLAGIRVARDGVVVDNRMRTSAPDVYACGDCTHFKGPASWMQTSGKLATNGVFQGKTAALNAIGVERVFDGFINACVTDVFGLRVGAVGVREEDAARAGVETLTGTGVSRDAYPMFEDSAEVTVKLVVDRASRQVIGGQVLGRRAVAERIDLIALAIHQELRVSDLAKLHHCAHPLQSGVPAHNPIVMAAEDAMHKLAAGNQRKQGPGTASSRDEMPPRRG